MRNQIINFVFTALISSLLCFGNTSNSAGTTTAAGNGELIEVTISFADQNGAPITVLLPGDSFRINIYAMDLRTNGDGVGVLSAFADVEYDTNLIDVTGILHVFDDFTTGMIDDGSGRVDEAGGLQNSPVSIREPQLLFYLEAVANRPGEVIIETNAGESVFSENQLFGVDGDLRGITVYGKATIEIEPIRPFDIDGNGVVDALTDGLLILRYMFGMQGDALVNDVVGSGCKRCDVSDIEPYLGSMTK